MGTGDAASAMRGLDAPTGKTKPRADARQGITLAVAGFLPILSILSLAPAVPALLARFGHVPYANLLVPLMVTAPGFVVALLSPLAGSITDRFGRRRPLLIASFFYGFFGVAPFFLDDLRLIFLSRLAVGASETFLLVIVNTLFADYFTVQQRRNWMTVQGIMGPVLGAISLMSAGTLAAIAWNAVFLIYVAAFGVFVAMLAWCFEPEVKSAAVNRGTPTMPFPVKTAVIYCAITLFSSVIYYVFVVQGALAFSAIGVSSSARIGAIMGLASLAVPVGAMIFNVVSRRVGGEWLIASYLIVLGIGTAGVGISRNEALMTGFAAVQELGAGMTVTTLAFWVSRLLPAEHRGRGFGFWTGAFFLGQFASAAIVAAVVNMTGGILGAFVTMGLLSVFGALAVIVSASHLPKPI